MYLSYYLFKYNDKLFCYDYEKHFLSAIDQYTYDILDQLAKTKGNQADSVIRANNAFSAFIKNDIFIHESEPCSKNMLDDGNIISFSFPTVHVCNLRCKYCFADHGDNFVGDDIYMRCSMVDKILHFVYNEYFPNYHKFKLDFVSGGEPLLNFDVVKYAIERVEQVYLESGKKTSIFLCTNGTIDKSQIWSFLDQKKVSIGVSIDGSKNYHDTMRPLEEGLGSYDKVLSTVSSILSNSRLSPHTRAVWGLSVLTGKTDNIKSILDHNRRLGITHMQMKMARLPPHHEMCISNERKNVLLSSYRELIDYFCSCAQRHNYDELKLILNDNDYFGKIMCRILDGGRIFRRCSAGINKLSFDAQGNIYPCDSFVGNTDFLLGNLENGILNKALIQQFQKSNVEGRRKCSSCWARYICGGDCFHNSYLKTGDMTIPDPVYCSIEKEMIRGGLYLYFLIRLNGDFLELKRYVKLKKKLEG